MSKEGKYVGEESLRTTMEQCIEGLDKKQDKMTAMSREYVRSLIPSDVKETLSKSAPVQITIKDSNNDPVVATAFSIKKNTVEKTSGTTDETGLCIYEDPSVMTCEILPCSLEYEEKSVELEVPEDATYAFIEILEDINGEISSEVIDTDGTIEEPDPYKLAPEGALSNWEYDLDDTNDIVTLNRYIGSETDVIVYANYIVNGVSYKTQLMCRQLFYQCGDIQTIKFSKNIDMSNITTMQLMFAYCSSLTTLDLSSFDTSNVTNMNSMFTKCISLVSLDLSSFDTSKVTNMSQMFYDCKELTFLNVSGEFNTSNVVNMERMFTGCESLQLLDLSNWDTSNVTNMTCMFHTCSSLTSLDLSSFDTSNVDDISLIFENCTNLTEILVSRDKWVIPSGCSKTAMFNNCGCSAVTYID